MDVASAPNQQPAIDRSVEGGPAIGSDRGVGPFVLSMGLSAAGSTVAMLGATAITAATGGGVHGALWTGAFLVVLFAAKAAVIQFVPGLSNRFGPERFFVFTNLASVLLWAGAGILVILGVPGTLVIMVIAPFVGVVNAVFSIEAPLLSKAYFSGHSMAAAEARVSVARGVSCAIGALGAGALINSAGAGYALIIRALCTVPLLLVLHRASRGSRAATTSEPVVIVDDLEPEIGPSILADPAVRRVILLAGGLTATTAPLVEMIVPIAESLRQTPLVIGASVMLAAMSAGELLSPYFVHRYERRQRHGHDPMSAALIVVASALLAFGLVSLVLTARAELAAWVLVGLVFGGAASSSHSVVLGQLVAAAGSFDLRRAIASMKLAMNIAAPVGFVLWAVLIDQVNATTAILVSAGSLILFTVTIGRSPKTALADDSISSQESSGDHLR